MPKVGTRLEPPQKIPKHFEEKVLEQILESIEYGAWPGTCALAAGVPKTAWDEWVRWGREGHEPFAAFMQRVEASKAAANLFHVKTLHRHSSGDCVVTLEDKDGNEVGVRTVGDWRPSAWWLSRMYASQFSEKEVLRAAAHEAIEKDQIQLSIPLLEQYLLKAGYRLVQLEASGRNQEASDGSDTAGKKEESGEEGGVKKRKPGRPRKSPGR